MKIEVLPSREDPQVLKIGDVEEQITKDSNPLLIPDIIFHENPKQTEILMEMLQDYQLGIYDITTEKIWCKLICIWSITGEHLLLIGNQGVGKNKLTDYFLQLLRLPREYIQLHRYVNLISIVIINQDLQLIVL